MVATPTYGATRDRVEEYFDRTATKTWERLTSDAPVSGIRQTVREGRDRMRAIMLSRLPSDLTGKRVLDAGCGTGAMTEELARRGAQVVAIDISPALVEIGERWAAGELDISIEHRATGIVQRLIGRLGPQFIRRGRSRGTVVVGAPEGESHSLVVSMLAIRTV